MNPNKRLYSPDAAPSIRDGVTGTDAADWTPDAAGTPSDHVIDAREWETVRVWPDFVGGVGTSVTLTPLLAVPAGSSPRKWIALPTTGALAPEAFSEIAVEGHFASFRVTALTLGAATSVNVRVTGGRQRRNIAGG